MHSAGSLSYGFHARREFARLARFGANVLDAHSCFIFLPRVALATLERRAHAPLGAGRGLAAPNLGTHSFGAGANAGSSGSRASLSDGGGLVESGDDLLMAGCHSLSQRCIVDCVLHSESGLIGWVARHGHPIHVSPFEHDSRTLGTYSEDQQLKSFIAVPLAMPVGLRVGGSFQSEQIVHGVIAADSKKAFAFSKLQGKLLEELAEQAASLIVVALASIDADRDRTSLELFFERAEDFCAAMGSNSVDALRVVPTNLPILEQRFGLVHVDAAVQQLYRLLAQSMPPHTPAYVSPTGEFICLVDNMMSSYFEGKAQALAEHLSGGMPDKAIKFRFQRSSSRLSAAGRRRGEPLSVMELVALTADEDNSIQTREQDLGNSVIPFSRFLRKVV